MVSTVSPDFSPYDYVDTPIFVVAAGQVGGYRLLYANPAHAQSTGLRREHICGRPVAEVFPASQSSMMARNYDAALTHGKPYRYTEALNLKGEERWYETTLIVMPTTGGGDLRIVGTSRDVTSRTRQDMSERLARLDFERFLGIAAHDLRVPMRQVGQIASLLREGFQDLGDGKADLIDALEDIGQNATKLVEDILTFVEADNLRAGTECLNLEKTCQQLLSLIDLEGRHRIEATPGMLRTDPLVLRIILRNLIENSVKHGGSDRLRIRVDASAETGTLVNLWYSDDGRGFEERDVLGTQTEEQDSRQHGYGLATVRRLLRARGGDIRTTPSRFGQGAGFALIVPGHLELLG